MNHNRARLKEEVDTDQLYCKQHFRKKGFPVILKLFPLEKYITVKFGKTGTFYQKNKFD